MDTKIRRSLHPLPATQRDCDIRPSGDTSGPGVGCRPVPIRLCQLSNRCPGRLRLPHVGLSHFVWSHGLSRKRHWCVVFLVSANRHTNRNFKWSGNCQSPFSGPPLDWFQVMAAWLLSALDSTSCLFRSPQLCRLFHE